MPVSLVSLPLPAPAEVGPVAFPADQIPADCRAPSPSGSPYFVGDRYIADVSLAARQRQLAAEQSAEAQARRAAWAQRTFARTAGDARALTLDALEYLSGARVAGVRLARRRGQAVAVVVLASTAAMRGQGGASC